MNFKERLTAYLICLMKHDDKEFLKCKRNDLIVKLLNKIGVDPDEFFNKFIQSYLN